MHDSIYFADPQVGPQACTGKTFTAADMLVFAAGSADSHRGHRNAEAAAGSLFGSRPA
jgi:acyl dehydratase